MHWNIYLDLIKYFQVCGRVFSITLVDVLNVTHASKASDSWIFLKSCYVWFC